MPFNYPDNPVILTLGTYTDINLKPEDTIKPIYVFKIHLIIKKIDANNAPSNQYATFVDITGDTVNLRVT